MPCPTREELSLLYDGELPAERLREVRAHVRECESCTAWLRDQARIGAAAGGRAPTPDCLTSEEIGELAEGVADEALRARAAEHADACRYCRQAWSRLTEALSPEKAPQRVRVRPTRVRAFAWTAVAAAAAALLAIAFWPSSTTQKPEQRGIQIATTPPGEDAGPSEEGPKEPPPTEAAPEFVQPPAGGPDASHAAPPTPTEAMAPQSSEGAKPRKVSPRRKVRRRPAAPSHPTTPPTPEPPALALVGGSALVQQWHDADGDDARFSREQLEELHAELPQNLKVLEALIRRTEQRAASGDDPQAEETLKSYRRELEAMKGLKEDAPPESTAAEPEAPDTGETDAGESEEEKADRGENDQIDTEREPQADPATEVEEQQ